MRPLGYLAMLFMVVLSVGFAMVLYTPRMPVSALPQAQLVTQRASNPLAARPPLSLGHLGRGLLLLVVGVVGLMLVGISES